MDDALEAAPMLRQLYTVGSLRNTDSGMAFEVKNRLFDATLVGIDSLRVDDEDVPLQRMHLLVGGERIHSTSVSPTRPLAFPLKSTIGIAIDGRKVGTGNHTIDVAWRSEPFGALAFRVVDSVVDRSAPSDGIPRADDNFAPEIVAARQRFIVEHTGVQPEHISQFSFDPSITHGNIENFTGVAQVPLGLAGPLRVNGEHAHGEFLIPMATAEGTLVASYNRGMKVLNESGGAFVTVVDDCMQRAPVFIFESAREARDFKHWVDDHLAEIAAAGEATTSVGKLLYIDTYLAARFAFLRFNFSTGDAAGQNMVGRATFAACSWILEQNDTIRRFFLESNFATDKKASQVNIMRTRGKRVIAEVTIPRHVLTRIMRVHPESLFYHSGVANVGSFLAGVNNNGLHSANGITAMFIATGQDVANVAESSAGVLYTDLTSDGDLYLSITIPSLIVATHGGGTGLATQRECLEILGCTGRGSVNKLAEIIGGVVLAGEISLASAISSLDWVSSHEQYGRNR
ncbi:MAG: hydroxymethylglutaryl-CoA reductase [Acidimicrobiia bacterium]